MKIRNGFVSNSSSSSFVVEYKDWDVNGMHILLNKDQVKLLTDIGFKPSCTNNEMEVYANFYRKNSGLFVKNKKDISSYIYCITCNQDDIIEELLRNNIEFKAACHYGHETVIYKDSKLYRYPNIGLQRATYISSIPDTDEFEVNPYLVKELENARENVR